MVQDPFSHLIMACRSEMDPSLTTIWVFFRSTRLMMSSGRCLSLGNRIPTAPFGPSITWNRNDGLIRILGGMWMGERSVEQGTAREGIAWTPSSTNYG